MHGPALPRLLRSFAAAGGALAGGLVAVPVGAALFVYLFERVGVRIVESVVSGVMDDVRGIEAFFAVLFLGVAGLVLAVMVVVALVAPVFVLVPMVAVAIAMKVSRAGLIMRTVGLVLVAVVGLGIGVALLGNVTGLGVPWWFVFPVLAVGGFAGRYVVEVWRPELAGVPDRVVLGPRWRRLTLAWLVIIVVGVAGAVAVSLLVTTT